MEGEGGLTDVEVPTIVLVTDIVDAPGGFEPFEFDDPGCCPSCVVVVESGGDGVVVSGC